MNGLDWTYENCVSSSQTSPATPRRRPMPSISTPSSNNCSQCVLVHRSSALEDTLFCSQSRKILRPKQRLNQAVNTCSMSKPSSNYSIEHHARMLFKLSFMVLMLPLCSSSEAVHSHYHSEQPAPHSSMDARAFKSGCLFGVFGVRAWRHQPLQHPFG